MKISTLLADWYVQHKRTLPWRQNPTPYKVWLSEIIMQQTRVAQGTPYYQRFLAAYPNVRALANAPLNDVLKLWEGLGYYSRARNLHAAAQQVAEQFNGHFPDRFVDLRQLKGVGAYTAAAIASICFNEQVAVVDGNVMRVISRLFGVTEAINRTEGMKKIEALAAQLITGTALPGEHNQAMMEFGALQCVPKNPNCNRCIFQMQCVAVQTGMVSSLPNKLKPKPVKHRYFHFLVAEEKGGYWLQQRHNQDIWGGLFQFPLIEMPEPMPKQRELIKSLNLGSHKPVRLSTPITHILSHQKLHINFWWVNMLPLEMQKSAQWFSQAEIAKLPMPIVLKRFVDANLLHLPASNPL